MRRGRKERNNESETENKQLGGEDRECRYRQCKMQSSGNQSNCIEVTQNYRNTLYYYLTEAQTNISYIFLFLQTLKFQFTPPLWHSQLISLLNRTKKLIFTQCVGATDVSIMLTASLQAIHS